MTERIWYELGQIKHNQLYCLYLLLRQKIILNIFNIVILVFSSAGIMGWKIWDDFSFIACIIIAVISLLKLISPHIIPSEKQIEKLNSVTDFYFDYFNKIEQLWFDHYNDRINDEEAQTNFYELKNTERDTNKTVNEIIKSTNNRIYKKTDKETRDYLRQIFKTE